MDAAIALATEPDEVVVLGDDLTGRPGEVDLEHRHVAAEVRHVEDEVVGELGHVTPDDPADTQRRQPELVTRGADRLHPRQPEVPLDVRRAERGEEGATGPVDVDVDVQPGVGLQRVECGGERGDHLVRARVGDAERRHDHDRVLIDPGQHVVGIHRVVPDRHRYLAHLDVPVLGELVPHDLHRSAHHVRSIGGFAGSRSLRPPAPLGRHPAQHARLRRSDRRRSHGVGRLGRVPQVGEHVHAAPLDLGRLRVLVLVDHVLVDRQVHQPVDRRFLPRLAERGQVLTGVAVEHELVGNDGEGVVGVPLLGGEAILGRRLRHVLAGVDGVVERGTDGLTGMQRHWLLLQTFARDPGCVADRYVDPPDSHIASFG